MKRNVLKKGVTVFALTIMILSQTSFLKVIGESLPKEVPEVTLKRVIDEVQNTLTSEPTEVKVGETVTLELSDSETADERVQIPLGSKYSYDEEKTKELNKDREDVTIGYQESTNTMYISWAKENAERNVKIAIISKSVGSSGLYAEVTRGGYDYKSADLVINSQQIKPETSASNNETTKEANPEDWNATSDINYSQSGEVDNNSDVSEQIKNEALSSRATPTTTFPLPPPASNVNIASYFNIPTLGSVNNSAAASIQYPQAAVITEQNPGLFGVLWAKTTIDLNFDFTTSMWIYMNAVGEDTPADGIAFVLQNDSNGDKAYGMSGWGLGTYGVNTDPIVKNALAIELDTYYNGKASEQGVPVFGDGGFGPPNYPGHIAAVETNRDLSYVPGSVGVVQHNNIQEANSSTALTQNKWQKFDINWEAKNQTLHYKFGDLPETSYQVQDLQKTFGGSSVRFGYTGSTGRLTSFQGVSFDRLPVAPVTVEYKDVDTGDTISDKTVLTGQEGSAWISEKKDINNYKYIRVDGAESGTFTERPQNVIYWYKKLNSQPLVTKDVKDITDTSGKVTVGDTLRYTITAKNDGEGTWGNVIISDNLQQGLDTPTNIVVTKVDGSTETLKVSDVYDTSTRMLKINVGDIATNQIVKISFDTVILSSAAGHSLENVAVGSGTNPDGSNTGGSDDANVIPPLLLNPDIVTDKKVENTNGKEEVRVGDVLKYTITSSNIKNDSLLLNGYITDTLPEGLGTPTNIVLTRADGVPIMLGSDVYDAKTRTLKVNIGDLAGGESAKLTFESEVLPAAEGKELLNVAITGGETPDGGSTEGTDTATVPPVDPTNPHLVVDKSVENTNGKEEVKVDDVLKYTIVATNDKAGSLLTNGTITDKIPEGLGEPTNIQVTKADGSVVTYATAEVYDEATRTLKVAIGDLAGSEKATLTFETKVLPESEGKAIENVAVAGGETPDGGSTEGTDTATVPPVDPSVIPPVNPTNPEGSGSGGNGGSEGKFPQTGDSEIPIGIYGLLAISTALVVYGKRSTKSKKIS
ncbi:isopeptide-forming domain-containing fimbrial protein [Carnobacterium divergens]|uniref:Isopeptide-forming domain-containing fimbrial protein n=1 Tax=Carnobacterium divergens TaxID=2748 RepID=A0AAW8R7F4_CARDV|nr:isopeptide-forming domain-containing fimbrial protein [Carnobacterium divergens]MDT1956820.1 isopeptide-forming domain-containing fimbrial protein [Carnobacterium divergens]MDT1972790.1 isopeptide-forming domain-containing fimbrial protein [Carnobacterium divergens]